jgi:hypothetical protein
VKSPSAYWSQVRRWDRQNSKILFDARGKVQRLLKAKLIFPDREREKLMDRHSRKVTDFLIYNFELWAKRGKTHNLAHALLQATEHLILWIYARNRQFQPYVPKWLFYHLETGRVPEARPGEQVSSSGGVRQAAQRTCVLSLRLFFLFR